MTLQHTRSVWIIEDSRSFAESLAELINTTHSLSCQNIFHNCEDAIDCLHRESPPDIILMDIGLPGMSGIDGIRHIKEIVPAVQVIILTVFEDNENIFHAIKTGAAGYLLKSATLDVILESLESILDGGAPVNPNIAKKILSMFAQSSPASTDYGLTAREKEVLQHLVEGLSKKQIGGKLFVTQNTVDTHLRNIYAKLQVNSKVSAVTKALKERIV
jgi:DNA-binding NarL/FixJ family response regulator